MAQTTIQPEIDVDVTWARSATYSFFAAALSFPDEQTLHALADADRWDAWRRIVRQSFPDLTEHLDAVHAALSDGLNDPDTLHEKFTDLFGHTVRGACPPYEMEYIKSDILRRAHDLADIAGFYDAFGMQMTEAGHERADHVVVQCEFMSVLAAKLAYAVEQEAEEGQQVLHEAQQSFLRDHLGIWMPALATRVLDADPDGFYGRAAALILAFLTDECRRYDVTIGAAYLELREVDDQQETSISCGVEESCPGADPGAGAGTGAGPDPLVQLGIDRT